MTTRPLSLAMLFGAAVLALGGCQSDSASTTKALNPIPSKTLALMEQKGMTRRDPILVRIYKEESQLEVWKKDKTGRYAHLKSYEICRWSGTLGPKKVEGDGQAPEGFYSVGPAQLNPNSQYYLSFNLGFPNAFDRSLSRSGAHLMVHGDCLSKGCYAMTDPQIAEVYAIAREALMAGQPSFQVQALPFRMTPENMARRRDDKNFAFWENLKEGTDHFELTKLEPKVDVCGQKYVFDATPTDGGRFDPNAACPPYQVEPSIAMAMASKERQDRAEFDKLVAGGLQTAEAYVPQNGRIRRSLDEPIKPPPAPVMTAKAEPQTTGSAGGMALAMVDTGSAVPMPVPSPYAAPLPRKGNGNGMFAWLRGDAKPAEPETTPRSTTGTTAVAGVNTRRTVAPGQAPIAASLAPTQKETFFKRWLGFGGKEPQQPQQSAPAAAPVPAPRPASVAAPVPQAAPEPAPSRAASAHDAFGAAPILAPGSFQ